MFDKILVANRGEIACRIIDTAKRLGVGTVAVYSEADVNARHVSLADEAIAIGPAPARDSYLAVEKLISAAERTGAEAIHPGYGFLSENAGFAEACGGAGITFIGPSPGQSRPWDPKDAAKTIMQQAGIPLVPGYHGGHQDEAFLLNEAEKIGFPVMLKASAGGGGRGMRVVNSAAGIPRSATFGKAGSAGGRSMTTGCCWKNTWSSPGISRFRSSATSMAMRYTCLNGTARSSGATRKVLEEAPAPGMTQETRNEMGNAAISAARAIDYTGAGTVEFIVASDGTFYFMEMNTRLQVEHPVTEMNHRPGPGRMAVSGRRR